MKIFLTILVALIIWNIVRSLLGLGLDDSDYSKHKRSGMKIYTDYKTGVQYLSAPFGGLCVRVDENGKPIRVETKK